MNTFLQRDRNPNWRSPPTIPIGHWSSTEQPNHLVMQIQELRRMLQAQEEDFEREREFKQKTFLQYQYDKKRQIEQIQVYYEQQIMLLQNVQKNSGQKLHQHESNGLKHELENFKQRLPQIEAMNSELVEQLKEKSQEITNYKLNEKNRENSIRQLQEKINNLESKNTEIHGELKTKIIEIEELKSLNNELTTQIKLKSDELSKNLYTYESLKCTHQALKSSHDSLKSTLESLKTTNQSLRIETEVIRQKEQKINNNLEFKIHELEVQLKNKSDELKLKSEELERMTPLLLRSEEQNEMTSKQYESHLRQLLREKEEVATQFEARRKEIIQTYEDKLKNDETCYIERLALLTYEYEKVQNKLKQYEDKHGSLIHNQADYMKLIQQLTKQLAAQSQDVKKMEQQIKTLQTKLQQNQRTEQAKSRQIMQLMNENQRLYTQLNLKRRLISQLAISYNFTL